MNNQSPRSQIFSDINDALRSNPIENASAVYKDIIINQNQDLLEEYKRLQELNKANVIVSSDVAKDLNLVLEKIQPNGVLVREDFDMDIAFEKVVYENDYEDIKDRLFSIDCSIVNADFAIANQGVVCVSSSAVQPRLASLITDTCIFLVKKESVLPNMLQALEKIKANGALPSNILFIAGPSRTADIELQVVFGVHGSREVYVIVY